MSVKPNVLCVGFAKCGTTTLYDIMKQHPDICLSMIKEPIYYGSKELVEERGFDWYLKRYYPKKTDKKVVMEINPILGRSVPAEQIRKDFGKETKIIFLIRNPINRLYSEFKMNLVDGTCFSPLEDNIGDSTSKLFDKWIANNFYTENGKIILRDNYSTKFCESGEYYSKIKNYLDVFGEDQVKVLFFEDFIKNPKGECRKIFNYVDVPFNQEINYDIHSNDGNRVPKSVFGMKASEIIFLKIYKEFLIEKLPYVSDNFCKAINHLTWQAPKLFSKINNNPEKASEEAREVITEYYQEMIENLSTLLDMDLFEKWKIEDNSKGRVLKR